MGSAAFLNEAINQLAEAYLQRKQKELGRTIPHDEYTAEKQRVKMYIADTNVFGVDLNPVAVELAEVSLWLNAIFKGSHVPWFGMQLHNGNSLVGARRDVFSAAQLSPGPGREGRARARLARRRAARRGHDGVTGRERRLPLPAAGRRHGQLQRQGGQGAGAQGLRDLQALARRLHCAADGRRGPPRQGADRWRSRRCGSSTPTELARVRRATSDELHVWPDAAPNRAPTTTAQKDAIFQREMLSEQVKNASPYRRLKLVMDYWCALWFWPLSEADAPAHARGMVVRAGDAAAGQCSRWPTRRRRATSSPRPCRSRRWTSRPSGTAMARWTSMRW